MSSKFTTTGNDTTVTFEYTAPTTTIQSVVGSCAEYLFEHGYGDRGTEETPVIFADLTNSQKLILVENRLKQVVVDLANVQKSSKAQQLARETEEASKYSL